MERPVPRIQSRAFTRSPKSKSTKSRYTYQFFIWFHMHSSWLVAKSRGIPPTPILTRCINWGCSHPSLCRILWTRNPDYWKTQGRILQDEILFYVEKISWKIFPTDEKRFYLIGGVDDPNLKQAFLLSIMKPLEFFQLVKKPTKYNVGITIPTCIKSPLLEKMS